MVPYNFTSFSDGTLKLINDLSLFRQRIEILDQASHWLILPHVDESACSMNDTVDHSCMLEVNLPYFCPSLSE